MEQSSISVNTTDTNYLSTNFGLRFRKKRTYSQMIKSSSMSEDNIANNIHLLNFEEEINKSLKKCKPIKEEVTILISAEGNKENIYKDNFRKKNVDEQQTLIKLEYNRISKQLTSLKKELKTEKIPKILNKILDYISQDTKTKR